MSDDRIIDFNDLKNKVKDSDVDKFEQYIYNLYFSVMDGSMTMAEFSRKIFDYMKDNNISQEKFMNIQKKFMERYGMDSEEVEKQLKNFGIDPSIAGMNNIDLNNISSENLESIKKSAGFYEKYGSKITPKSCITTYIKNDVNDIEIVNLSHEKLINDAITAYNAIKQDPTIFGIDLEDWNNLVDKVFESKTTLMQIKLSKASLEVQNLQQEINNLPTTFNINLLDTLKTISNKINNLKADDKLILDLTNYNNLVSSYNEYIANLEAEIMPTIKAIDSTMIYVVISTIGSLSVIAMVLVSKKFLFK